MRARIDSFIDLGDRDEEEREREKQEVIDKC